MGFRKRVSLQNGSELLPCETRSIASTAKPFDPVPLRGFDQWHQAAVITTYTEVVEVSLYASAERGVLHSNRLMSMATTIIGCDIDRLL